MTSPKTYREWLICNDSRLAIQKGSGAWDLNLGNDETVHVIEHQALKDAEAEIERLRIQNESLTEMLVYLDGVLKDTQPLLDKAVVALAEIDHLKSVAHNFESSYENIKEQLATANDVINGLNVDTLKLSEVEALLDKAVTALEIICDDIDADTHIAKRKIAKQALENIAKARKP